MAIRLQYFNTNGLGEPIRYILHYAGEKFEDVRYIYKDWPIKEVKDSLPYGTLPLYEEGNRSINQSLAIARYVGAKAKLVPTDLWEQAVLDAAVLNILDFWQKVGTYFLENDPIKKEAIKKSIFDETVGFYFSRFEKELKANKGFFGGKLSWVDFVLVGYIECFNLFLEAQVEKDYPTVKALMQKILSLPGVKAYTATRKPYIKTV